MGTNRYNDGRRFYEGARSIENILLPTTYKLQQDIVISITLLNQQSPPLIIIDNPSNIF